MAWLGGGSRKNPISVLIHGVPHRVEISDRDNVTVDLTFGGGIGGLTSAVALKHCSSIEIDLYEQATHITEIGAGITVWPRTWEVLKSLGLEQDLLALLPEGHSDEPKLAFEYRLSDRKEGFTFHKVYARGGALCFHRQEILAALLKHVPESCRIHLSHRLSRYSEETDNVKLWFENGKEATCDLLVAADGIRSVVRDSSTSIASKGLFYTGSQCFRGLIPKEKLEKLYPDHRALYSPINYCGKNQHIIVYPISGGKIINVVAFFTRLEEEGRQWEGPGINSATTEDALGQFSGWEDEVVQLLGCIETPTRWAIQDLYPLQTYASRRVALVGTENFPFIIIMAITYIITGEKGAGAGQAIEDGYILGQLFLNRKSEKWEHVLQAYNFVRQPFVNMIKNMTRIQGLHYELNSPGLDDVTNVGQELSPEQISLLRSGLTENRSWWEADAEEELRRAIEVVRTEN
ncbi:hypothetical protein D9757_008410 [Collybiopsis confluens]|uniref:FAD-binding domain-containing protein n=1 Tax=Collybiopsis confluens TaxID=2823264 RepID=A0A8H5HHI2_9AGAR|nr:hypothetical protein D9757_008410 [Collybiopsis confluens]